MADLGKVLNGLEHCTSAKYPYPCNECVYRCNIDYNDPWSCRISVMRDALELLKAQEPVEPIFDELAVTGACGNCGHELAYQKMIGDNVLFEEQFLYCPNCGKAVKWDA